MNISPISQSNMTTKKNPNFGINMGEWNINQFKTAVYDGSITEDLYKQIIALRNDPETKDLKAFFSPDENFKYCSTELKLDIYDTGKAYDTALREIFKSKSNGGALIKGIKWLQDKNTINEIRSNGKKWDETRKRLDEIT